MGVAPLTRRVGGSYRVRRLHPQPNTQVSGAWRDLGSDERDPRRVPVGAAWRPCPAASADVHAGQPRPPSGVGSSVARLEDLRVACGATRRRGMRTSSRLLSGLRVLDLADEKAELCGRVLADLGAEVIRVEPIDGARSRRLGPFADNGGASLYFALRNAGKRGMCLDLEGEDGRRRFLEMAGGADVVVETFQPGVLEGWGVGPAALLEQNPALIVTSITDFGQDGPYRDYTGTDMVGFAMGGLMSRSGRPERPPLVAPGNLAYDVTGIAAAHATLLGFYQRLRTGRGQHLDVSVLETVSNFSDGSLPGFSVNPTVVHRTGSGIYPLYRCADGWVRMIILVPGHWRTLMTWMGHPEELADPAYEQFVHRLMNMDKINPVIDRFFADKPKIDAAKEAQRRGITATPLLLPSEVLDNEHTVARKTFVRMPLGGGIEARLPSGFLTIDGERAGPACGPPELGELGDGSWSEDGRERVAVMAATAPGPAADGYPLRGLRVIDFGVGAVGVEVGRLFAEYGADVIKIETRRAPDFYRAIFGNYMNPNFASSNRTKRSFGVDLKTERGWRSSRSSCGRPTCSSRTTARASPSDSGSGRRCCTSSTRASSPSPASSPAAPGLGRTGPAMDPTHTRSPGCSTCGTIPRTRTARRAPQTCTPTTSSAASGP